MVIEATILASEIHVGIQQLTTNPHRDDKKVIGFLTAPSGESEKVSVVTAEGKTLGDYCCEGCATKAAFIHAYGLPVSESEEPDIGIRLPAALLLMAMLASRANRH